MASNTPAMRQAWKEFRCIHEHPDRVRVKILGVNAGVCPPDMVEPFEALSQALENSGYANAKRVEIPRPCSRGIKQGVPCSSDGSNCSLHNYGIAVDVDPQINKKFADGTAGAGWTFPDVDQPGEKVIKLTKPQVEAVLGIRTLSGKRLFRWLGDTKINDTMHFEVQVAPSETPVDWTTVPGGVPPETSLVRGMAGIGGAPPFPGVVLKRGSDGPDVCLVQERLRELGHSIDSRPGCPFGPQTEKAVKAFQQSQGLEDDGRVGKLTWLALFGSPEQ